MLREIEGRETTMRREIAEIPARIARQLQEHGQLYADAGRQLRERAPRMILTVARGSSDCAADFLKQLVENRIGIPAASVGPSLASVYKRNLRLERGVSWAISQSGASEDTNALQRSNREAGALAISLVNSSGSRLEQSGDIALPIGAGTEFALPATKSFVCTLVAIAAVVAAWAEDTALRQSLDLLPDLIARSNHEGWSAAVELLADCDSALILGRGIGYPIAREAALKLQETCYIFAAAFSAAEVWHGPAALITPERPVIVFAQADDAHEGLMAAADRARDLGARVLAISKDCAADALSVPDAPNSAVEVITMIARFYGLAERAAARRGVDPDAPRGLQKVTMTV